MLKSSEYRDESERLMIALYELCRHYGRNPNFMADFQEFIETHRSELTHLARTAQGSGPLLAEAKRIADRWGLQALWAPQTLTDAALLNYSRRWGGMLHGIDVTPNPSFKYTFPLQPLVTMYPLPPLEERTIKLTMEYDAGHETRAAVRARAMHEVDRQIKIIERRFEAIGLMPRDHKSELAAHVLWLYERIALKLTPAEIVEEHHNDPKPPGQDAIEEGISKLARLLRITLPRNRTPNLL